MKDQELENYFEFNEFDLQTNRMGQFTEKQKARLAKKNKGSMVWHLIAGTILTLLGLGSGFLAFSYLIAGDGLSRILGFGIFFIVAIFLCVCGLVMVGSAFQKSKWSIERVEDKVDWKSDKEYVKGRDGDRILRIGGKKFEVDADLADVMKQGATYAVNILKKGNVSSENATLHDDAILSLELISKAK